MRSIPTLHDLWPETKFVHLIRDGRDVFLSMINWKKADSSAGQFSAWKEDQVSMGALWWELTYVWAARTVDRWPPSSTTRSTTKSWSPNLKRRVRISATSWDCPTTTPMLRFHEGHEIADPDLDAKKGWRPLTPGLRKRSEEELPRTWLTLRAAAGVRSDELGYPRAARPTEEVLAWTARIRESFTSDVPSSGDRLPVGWTT